jgi:ATP-dependent RNA helicase A
LSLSLFFSCLLSTTLHCQVLEAYPSIKIVLMGATMDTKLYEVFFSVPEESLRIDGRAVPQTQTILHCDELSSLLPLALHAKLRSVADSTSSCAVVHGQPVADTVAQDQLTLAAALIKQIASEKSSILVFVSGMADICDLVEAFEKTKIAPLKLRVIIIHSDMPHEEQLLALQPLAPGEARVIIATHAAESSLALPDCDHVICMGTDDAVPVTADGRYAVYHIVI